MSWKSVGILSLTLFIALALVGCDLISVVGVGKGSLRIQGIVLDEDNRGISGAAIEIDSKPVVFTGSDGRWSYDKATKGAKVDVKKDGYIFGLGPTVVESDNQTITFIGKKVESAGYGISGRVVDEDGNDISSVTITFRGDSEATTVTDAEGKFSRGGLRGTVTISAAKNGYTITEQFVVTGVDENITFVARIDQTPYEVMGRIVSTGRLPVEGVVVSFADEKGGVKTAVTDADGYFWKSGLIGQAAVTAYLEGWLFTPETRVVDGPESDLNFYGTPDSQSTYTVSGAVVDFDGVAISGVSVRFDFLDLDRESLFTVTGPDGSWTMDGLIGRVKITPLKSGLTFYPAYQITDKAAMSIGFRVQ